MQVFLCEIAQPYRASDRYLNGGPKRDKRNSTSIIIDVNKKWKMGSLLIGLTRVTVGRVGVGAAAVERTARRRCHSLPVTSPGAQEEDGRDDGDHQDQSCHGYANGEIAGRYAQLILVHRLQCNFIQ